MAKEDWTIMYSQELGEKIGYHNFRGEVVTENGRVKYSRAELKLLDSTGITRSTHLVKKVFEGRIVK